MTDLQRLMNLLDARSTTATAEVISMSEWRKRLRPKSRLARADKGAAIDKIGTKSAGFLKLAISKDRCRHPTAP